MWLRITLLKLPEKVVIYWASIWISHGTWIFLYTAWIRMRLSPSIWILVNPACVAALVPFRMAVTSAKNTDTTPKLNAAAYRNRPVQSRMRNPATAPWEFLDPSKLILTNLPWSFLHVIHSDCLRLRVEWCSWHGWNDCDSLCLTCHSALARFACKRYMSGLDDSLRKTLLFLVFQRLQRSATILFIWMNGNECLKLESQFYIFIWELLGRFTSRPVCAASLSPFRLNTSHSDSGAVFWSDLWRNLN